MPQRSLAPTAPGVTRPPSPPPFEVADIVRAYGAAFRATHRVSQEQARVLRAIAQCRTAALGGHVEQCVTCGTERICYDSCRNRHCPKCQGSARAKWLAAEQALLLPVPYFHVVFTLPHHLNPLIRVNQRSLYDLLFQTAAQTLQEFARDPNHLGAEIGITAVLHTWGQTLTEHIHVHCVVTGGGLSLDGTQWRSGRRRFLFAVKALGQVFRGKYLAGLERLRSQQRLTFAGESAPLGEDCAWTALRQPAPRQTLGGLRQTAVGQSRAGPEVSQPLHPSCGHCQFAPRLRRRRGRALSLHGLRSGRHGQGHGTAARRNSSAAFCSTSCPLASYGSVTMACSLIARDRPSSPAPASSWPSWLRLLSPCRRWPRIRVFQPLLPFAVPTVLARTGGSSPALLPQRGFPP